MAKRISSSSVNWGLISSLVSSDSRNAYVAFKTQSEKYLRDIASLPAALPQIDWNSYKKQIAAPGVVDNYQKNYESLKIPYPSDQGWIARVEADGQKRSADFEKVRQEGLKKIAQLKEELKSYEKEIPFEIATMEELILMRPELNMYSDKDPKLWPLYIFDERNAQPDDEEQHH